MRSPAVLHKRNALLSCLLALALVMGFPLMPLAQAGADPLPATYTIQDVRDLIEQLPAPTSVTENDGAFIQQTRAAYDSLSDEERRLLDTETNRDALHTTQSYGRVLELAEIGYAVLHAVDNSTSLPDGIYTTSVTSTWSRGKSASKQDRDWIAARVRVENGAAQVTLSINSSTYRYVRAAGAEVQRQENSGVEESRFTVPVTLNAQMPFLGYSETMATEIGYFITVSVPENAQPDFALGSAEDNEGTAGSQGGDVVEIVGAPETHEAGSAVVVEKGVFTHPEVKGYMFRIVGPTVIESDGASMVVRAEMPSESYGYFCVDTAENAESVSLEEGIEEGYFIEPEYFDTPNGEHKYGFVFPLSSLDQDIDVCLYSKKNEHWVSQTLRFNSADLEWYTDAAQQAQLAQTIELLENLPPRNEIVPNDPDHEATVAAARAAYDALNRLQKAQVPPRLVLLLDWVESMFDLGFNTDQLPLALVGQPYKGEIYVSGKNGSAGKSISVVEGALPPGIGLEMDNGGLWAQFTGTPQEVGTSTFTVEIANGLEPNVRKEFTLHVGYAPRILTQSLAQAQLGTAYEQIIEADAYPDATWSLVGGTLPEGISFADDGSAASTARLSGTPREAGDFAFTLACDNFANGVEQVTYTLRVVDPTQDPHPGAGEDAEGTAEKYAAELKALKDELASLKAQRSTDATEIAKLKAQVKKLEAKLPKEVVVNAKTVSKKAVQKALKKANNPGAKQITLGAKVKKIKRGAFADTLATKLVVKTTKLSKKSVKGALKGSKVKTVQVKVAKKKLKSTKKKYKSLFTKKVAGKKANVK